MIAERVVSMRVPLSWLKDFVEITIPLDDLIHRMIMAGLEVANVEHIGDTWQRDKLFVGEVLEIKPHPNAERLVLAVVEYGQGTPQTVVTGAPNLRPGERGQKVAFAVEGAELLDGHSLTPRGRSSSGLPFVAWSPLAWSVLKKSWACLMITLAL